MDNVSIAALDSFLFCVLKIVSSSLIDSAVRKDHLFEMQTKLNPLFEYVA